MFNIWKQAWRNAGPSRTDSRVVSGASDQLEVLSGTSDDQAIAGSATDDPLSIPRASDAAVPESLPSQTPSSISHKKRTVSSRKLEDDTEVLERPGKRFRLSGRGEDSVAHYLPEIVDDPSWKVQTESHEEDFITPQSYADDALEHAKQLNTLLVLDAEYKAMFVMQLSEWAATLEKGRMSEYISKRVALFVSNDDFGEDQPQIVKTSDALSVGTYTDVSHGSNNWLDLTSNDVVVIPAKLFLDSLLEGILSFAQVSLMIVDDAQNAKDPHPMARIMREFYRSALPDERPRIVGLLNPQGDTRLRYDIGTLRLEKLLDATVLGVSPETRSEVMALPDRPSELVVFYDPHLKLGKIETPLLRQLLQIDPTAQCFKKQFKDARNVGFELGSCATDLVWRKALWEMDPTSIPMYDHDDDDDDAHRNLSIKTARIQRKVKSTVKNWIFTMPNLDSTSRGYNVTPKLVKLVQVLKACEPQGDSFRGIVFVQRRVVAHAMLDILRMLSDYVGFLRPQVITGSGAFINPRAQQDLLEDFRLGTTNLLIATKFAEDLEIPPCSCVVRFNMFDSHVSYAYCCARTRGRDSHLIHMAERGNDVHRRLLFGIAGLGKRMQKWVDSVADGPGSSPPPSSLMETPDPYRSDSDEEDNDEENVDTFVKDPTTSARIHAHNATTVIYRFVASLDSGEDDSPSSKPLFEFRQVRVLSSRNLHVCSVVLPPSITIGKVSGSAYPTQSSARRAACLRTCRELFYKGFLNYRFFPRPHPVTLRPQRGIHMPTTTIEDNTSDSDEEGVSRFPPAKRKGTGIRTYPRRRPDFWVNTAGVMLGRLYPTIVSTKHQEDPSRPYQPILMLTRLPLPPIESFNFFFSGVPSNVYFQPGASFDVGEDKLGLLHQYTLRTCRVVANKPFVCKLEDMAFFLAPLASTWNVTSPHAGDKWNLPNVEQHIPWDLVSIAAEKWVVPLDRENLQTLSEDIKDAVIQDRWVEFTRRYDVVAIRPDLNPLSKPADSPREAGYENLAEYCRARRKGFEGLEDYTQPLIEIERVPAITNHLNPSSRVPTESKKNPAKYLIPELCCRLTIPASTLRMMLLIPSIARRLDDVLLVKELNAKFFDHCIVEGLLHTAVSMPSAGAEFDYERLELLGDAYLKYLSSIYLFVTNPTQNEGALHISRQRIISNRALLKNAVRTGLPQYIQSKPFTSKAWMPQNFQIFRPPKPIVPSEQANEDIKHEEPPEQITDVAGDQRREPIDTRNGVVAANEHSLPSVYKHKNTEETTATDNPKISAEGLRLSAVTDIRAIPGHSNSTLNDNKSPVAVVNKKPKRAQEDTNAHALGDKGIADVAEAIIGAAYITAGRELALRVTKALNVPVPHIDRWTDFARKTLAPPPDVSAELKPGTVEHIEDIIQHPFRRPHLLAQALTHASIQGHEMTCYERLEFIGDAILDFLVIRYIFNRDGQQSPGALTLLKGSMVSNSTLAAVCVYADLHEHLLYESDSIASSIQDYSKQLEKARQSEYALAESEGREPGQYWVDVEQPKVLSDVVESVLGAIYVSDNFSPDGVEAFFDVVLKPFFDKHITLKTLSHHPTKSLFEIFQSQGCQEFRIIKEMDHERPGIIVCDVICHDIVLARAEDTSQSIAARRASFWALDALEGDMQFMNRTCTCRNLHEAKKTGKKTATKKIVDFDEADAAEVEEMATVQEAVKPNINELSSRA